MNNHSERTYAAVEEPPEGNLQTEYKLTEDEMGMIRPMLETIESLQKETQSILRAITRLRMLDGNWTLAGDRLIKVNDQPRP